MSQLITSWVTLLDGELTIDSTDVNVYPEDADSEDTFHYVVIKAESETDSSNKSSFVTNPVVIVDIVTVHGSNVKRSIVDSIDDQIRELLFPTRQCALPALDGLQITNVQPNGSTYLNDYDGSKKYYRKVTRYSHRITQI